MLFYIYMGYFWDVNPCYFTLEVNGMDRPFMLLDVKPSRRQCVSLKQHGRISQFQLVCQWLRLQAEGDAHHFIQSLTVFR